MFNESQVEKLVEYLIENEKCFTVYDVYVAAKFNKMLNCKYFEVKKEIRDIIHDVISAFEGEIRYSSSLNILLQNVAVKPMIYHPFGINFSEEYDSQWAINFAFPDGDEEDEELEDCKELTLTASSSNGRIRLYIPKTILSTIAGGARYVSIYCSPFNTLMVTNIDNDEIEETYDVDWVCDYKVERDGAIRISEMILEQHLDSPIFDDSEFDVVITEDGCLEILAPH